MKCTDSLNLFKSTMYRTGLGKPVVFDQHLYESARKKSLSLSDIRKVLVEKVG